MLYSLDLFCITAMSATIVDYCYIDSPDIIAGSMLDGKVPPHPFAEFESSIVWIR
jgi:hypothetical protein